MSLTCCWKLCRNWYWYTLDMAIVERSKQWKYVIGQHIRTPVCCTAMQSVALGKCCLWRLERTGLLIKLMGNFTHYLYWTKSNINNGRWWTTLESILWVDISKYIEMLHINAVATWSVKIWITRMRFLYIKVIPMQMFRTEHWYTYLKYWGNSTG